jgi:hypothetical protein
MKHQISRFSVFGLLTLLLASFAHADVLQTQPPPTKALEAAIQTLLPVSDRQKLDSLVPNIKPVVIFLPGIMGSKLSRVANGVATPFWGTPNAFLRDDSAFRYHPTDTISAEVLDDIYVKGVGAKFDIYGVGYKEIRSVTGLTDDVLRFAYDWRQSNVLSANDFSKWICSAGIQSVIKGRPVIFIAHSMGGLVLKYWLKHHYRAPGCGEGTASFASYMPIFKIMFVGTPHYGAPKAVLAFSQGESLFFDRPNDEVIWRNWARLLNWADVNLISGNLNRYGIHYPSSYQLLPIYETPRPNCLKSDLKADIEFGSSTGHFPAKYDIFDPGAWKDLGWPVQLKGKERDDFQKNELPGLLEQAQTFLCDVAAYDVDAEFDVVNFYGLHQDTPCKINFLPPDYAGKLGEPCTGDGTVPDWIAARDWKEKQQQESNSEPHMRQIAAVEFGSYLRRISRKLYEKFVIDAGKNTNGSEAAANVLAKIKFVPIPGPTVSSEDAASIRKVADLVVAKLDIDPAELIEKAKTEPNAATRVNQMQVYINSSAAEPLPQAWAFNNAAHIYLAQCNFRQSSELAKSALNASNELQALKPELSGEMRNVRAKSAWVAALSAGQLGQPKEAERFRDIAIKNGSRFAASVPLPTPQTRCSGKVKLRPPALDRGRS